MEGIFIMLLYLIAGFFKNRRDKAKRNKIQSDPNWDDSKSGNDLNFNNCDALEIGLIQRHLQRGACGSKSPFYRSG